MATESGKLASTSERPLSLHFQVNLASASEKLEVLEKLKAAKRQTMNLRTMPQTEILLLRDQERDGRIIGWQGLGRWPEFDIYEKFSLHLDVEYRSFLLGLALETVAFKHLVQKGVSELMGRMNVEATVSLRDYRMSLGFMREVPKSELPFAYLSKCGNCELHNKTCNRQIFFSIALSKAIEFGERRLGMIQNLQFPYPIILQEDSIRKAERPYSAKFVA